MAYTTAEFQNVRRALLTCNDADRAYLRRWVLRWIDERGRVAEGAEPLPDQGCPESVPAKGLARPQR